MCIELPDNTLRAQPLSVVLTIAQGREHLVRMLSQARAQMPDTPRRVAQLQSHASLLYHLTIGGTVGEQHLTVLHLRVSEDFGGSVHRTDTDIFISQRGQPVVAGTLQENSLQLFAHAGLLRGGSTGEVLDTAVVARQVRATEGFTEIFPEPGLAATDREAATVLRLIGGVEGIQARVGAMAPLRHEAVGKSIGHEGSSGQQSEGGIEIRDVDVLATSDAVPGKQREQDAYDPRHGSTAVIGNDVERNGRRTAHLTNEI